AKKEGRADWLELFWGKADLWANPELPRLHAWLPRAGLGEGQRVVFERNPYYWKVDTRGSQLPYIDEIAFEIISDMETMLLKALEVASTCTSGTSTFRRTSRCSRVNGSEATTGSSIPNPPS